ncbi:Carboxypeptidase T [Phycisphaerales bacterium]|nr:Carboxypeptidase T [Phycisphaerales bacterium]
MRSNLLALLAAAALAGPAAFAQQTPPAGPYHGHKVVRVTVNDHDQLAQALDIAVTAWNCRIGVGPIDLQVTDEQLAALRGLGLEPVVIIPDVQELIDREEAGMAAARAQADAAWFSTFRTLPELHARLDYYQTNYSNIASTFIAGQTLEGRNIKGVRITGPDLPGNPRATRPAIIFNACQHAREWATPMTAMWIADRLIESYGTDQRLTDIVNNLEVIVIPVVNGDGYEFTWTAGNRLWRKNRRDNGNGTFGVDTNRNWGFQWGGEGASTSPGNDTYRGTGPFSEPETQVMRDFITANPRLTAHIDIHSYSQLILSSYGYSAIDSPDRPVLNIVDAAMHDAILAVHGRFYAAGPTYTTIYPASGVASDWTAGDRGLLGCGIEVRDTGSYGFVMPVEEIIPNAEENFEGAMKLAEYAMKPVLIAPIEPAPAYVSTIPTPVAVNVRPVAGTLAGLPLLYVRSGGGPWTSTPVSLTSGFTYAGLLPAAQCGETVEYYFEATTTAGQAVRFPTDGASAPIGLEGLEVRTVFTDDLEQNLGWTTGAPGDAATLGLWSRCDPEPTAAQPADDHTAGGTLAWITDCRAGTGVGAFDVDGGATTLTSPMFSALGPSGFEVSEARLSYWRWYSNNQGSNPNTDAMLVQLSNNDGQSYLGVEVVTENAGQWVHHEMRIDDLMPPTAQMRLRFIAQDLGGGSIVEAGVDDVLVRVFGCTPCDPDVNCDGSVNGFDIEATEQAVNGDYSNFCQVSADLNGDGAENGFDIETEEQRVNGGPC